MIMKVIVIISEQVTLLESRLHIQGEQTRQAFNQQTQSMKTEYEQKLMALRQGLFIWKFKSNIF